MREEPSEAPSRLRAAAPYLALTAIVLAMYADPLVTGRVFFYRDLGMAMRPVLAEARSGGEGVAEAIPLWTHALSNGRPLIANPSYSLVGPMEVLYRFLPFDLAFNLFLVLHVAIAACAMAFLARRLGCSRAGAFAAGAAYALGGGLVSAVPLYMTVVSAAWAPLVIAAGLAAAREPKLRRLALLALPIGLQAMGGQSEFVGATLVVGFFASLAWAEGSALGRLRIVVTAWGGGVAGGLALAAPQLLPAALHARTTLRAMGFTAEGLLANSLHPLRALWLVVPRLGGNPIEARAGGFPGAALLDGSSPYLLSIYLGIVTVGLAAAALVLSRRHPQTRSIAWTLAGVAIAGVVLACGRYVPGAQALAASLPFSIPFRFPEKALYVTFLAVAPLAALGVDAVRTLGIRRLPTLLALAVVPDLAFAHAGFTPTIAIADLAAPPLAKELVARSRALGVPDGQWRVHHERQRDSGGWGPPTGSIPPSLEDLYRWQVRMLVPPSGAPHGIHAAMESSGDHLDDLRYFSIVRAAYTGPSEAWVLALGEAAVLWVVSPQPGLEAATSGLLVREIDLGPTQGVPPGSGYVYRNTRFVSRAHLAALSSLAPMRRAAEPSAPELTAMAQERYSPAGSWPPPSVLEVEDVASERAFLGSPHPALPNSKAQNGLARTVHAALADASSLEQGDSKAGSVADIAEEHGETRDGSSVSTAEENGDSQAGSVASISEDHRGLGLSIEAKQPALLVVSDVPGAISAWNARVDGRPATVHRANIAYLAVPVPSGRHEVRLDYRPAGLTTGIAVMVAALLACGAAVLPRRLPRPPSLQA